MSVLEKVTLHNSRFFSDRVTLVAQLEVRHLMGSHYETWRGRKGEWENSEDPELKPNRRRRRILNQEWTRNLRRWWEKKDD